MTGNILKITTLFFVLLLAENVSASERSECKESGGYYSSGKCWSSKDEYKQDKLEKKRIKCEAKEGKIWNGKSCKTDPAVKAAKKLAKQEAKCERKADTHIMIDGKCKPDPAKKAEAKLKKEEAKCEKKADTHKMIDGKCKKDPEKKAAAKLKKEEAKCEKKADTHKMIDGKCKKDPEKKAAAKLAKEEAKCEKKADTHTMIEGKCKKDPAKKNAEKQAKCEKKAGKKWDAEKNKCVNDEAKLEGLEVYELNSRKATCKPLSKRKAAKAVIDNIKFFASDADCRAKAGSVDDAVIFKKSKSGTCSRIEGGKALRKAKNIDNKTYFKTEAECTESGGTVAETIFIQKKNKCTSIDGKKAEKFKEKSSNAGKFWTDKASCETALNEAVADEVFEFKKKFGGKRVCSKLNDRKAAKVKDQIGLGTYFKGLASCEEALKNYLGSDADSKKCIDVFRKAYTDVFKKKKTDSQAVAFVKSKGCGK
jgi:hypothetical protein